MLNWFRKKKMVEKKEGNPKAFTCGKCRNVVSWNKELKCPNCDGKIEEKDEEE